MKRLLSALFLAFALCAVATEPKLPSSLPSHPRLLLTNVRLHELKNIARSDPRLQGFVADVMRSADDLLAARPLTYDKIGPRILHVSRECLHRTYTLGLAWRWTGQRAYARAAVSNLLVVCAFKDWNPSHFLDTAEMSHAVGIGYDWLYGEMSATERKTVRDRLVELGLKPGLSQFAGRGNWWVQGRNNWTQVCAGGLLVGALAVADTDRAISAGILTNSVAALRAGMGLYGPDGAWVEGPGYWDYATSYLVYGLAAMKTALGSDFDLDTSSGLAKTVWFPLYMTAPGGSMYSFADVGSMHRRAPSGCMFWLAEHFGLRDALDDEHRVLDRYAATPAHVIWYEGPSGRKPVFDLDRIFGGRVEVATMRSAWDDPAALWVAAKAGDNQTSHGHLDLGSFELEKDGVRWALDLGGDFYELPGYWDMREGGGRWKYFRLGSLSHNLCTVDGCNQSATGRAKLIGHDFTTERGEVILDLTSAYPQARRAWRGIALVNHRTQLIVRDEFEFDAPHTVTWGMTTRATIETTGTNTATLRQPQTAPTAQRPQATTFLTQSVPRTFQFFDGKMNDAKRRKAIAYLKQQGYTTAYVCMAVRNNESQGYTYSADKKVLWRLWLGEFARAGIDVVAWMRTDDAKDLDAWSEAKFNDFCRLVHNDLGDLVSSYCLGIECDEWGWGPERIARHVQYLRDLTGRKIGVHTTGIDAMNYAATADLFYLQYGFGRTLPEIEEQTRRAKAFMGATRRVIAAEYNLAGDSDAAKEMGEAAIRAGADGFGNGGTSDALKMLTKREASPAVRSLWVHVDTSGAHHIAVESAERKPPEADNRGVRRMLVTQQASTQAVFSVFMGGSGQEATDHDRPLSEWRGMKP